MINSVFRNVGMILQTDSSTNDLQIVKNSLQTQAYKQQAEQELVVNNNHWVSERSLLIRYLNKALK